MDFYQQYDVCCITTLHRDILQFRCGKLIYINDCIKTDENALSGVHQARFTYNQNTNEFAELYTQPTTERGVNLIYVDNIANSLYDLYKQQLGNLFDNKIFLTIAQYLKHCFQQQSEEWEMKQERIYHAFIIPNEWQLEPDIIADVLVPLFSHIGISFPLDNYEREQFVTEAEAMLVHFQGWSAPIGREQYMYGESRCILHDVHFEADTIQLKTTYFQLKEHDDLRARGIYYCTPKIAFVNESRKFNYSEFEDMKELVQLIILKNSLKLDDDIVSKMQNNSHHLRGNVKDYFIETVLFNASEFHLDKTKELPYDENLLKNYLSESQLAYIKSEEFYITVMLQMMVPLDNPLTDAYDYMKAQYKLVPFFRKSIILNQRKCTFEGWFQARMYAIFFCLLYLDIYDKNDSYMLQLFYIKNKFGLDKYDYELLNGTLFRMTFFAVFSNALLPPIVIAENSTVDEFGFPVYLPLKQIPTSHSPPNFIVYMDVSPLPTKTVCEILDGDGFTQDSFTIEKLMPKDVLFEDFSITNNESNNHQLIDHTVSSLFGAGTKIGVVAVAAGAACAISLKPRLIDRSQKLRRSREKFASYLQEFVKLTDQQLELRNIPLEQVRYVLCLEKSMENPQHMESRGQLIDLVNENYCFKSTRKMVITNQGEKTVWSSLQKTPLKPPSYFVHSHISDDYICIKSHQVVDLTATNDGIKEKSTVELNWNTVPMKNVYEQACELIWDHIHSLDENHRRCFVLSSDKYIPHSFDKFKTFNQKMTQFIKEKMFIDQQDIHKPQYIELSDGYNILISVHQIICLAVIPIINQLVTVIMSCVMNIYGGVAIDKLFVTGRLLPIREFSDIYHHAITTAMTHEFQRLIAEKTYRTKLEVAVSTSRHGQPTPAIVKEKAFCYDMFMKGELVLVPSATFILDKICTGEKGTEVYTSIQNSATNVILQRGEKFPSSGMRINLQCDSTNVVDRFKLGLNRYVSALQDTEESCGFINAKYLFEKSFSSKDLITITVRKDIRLSCFMIECQYYIVKDDGKMYLEEEEQGFGERFTLKYFNKAC